MRLRHHRIGLIAVVLILVPPALPGRDAESPGTAAWSEPELRRELLAMRDADQALRARFLADPEAHGPELAALDARHTERAREILDEDGWPTSEQVGKEGSEALWLILQHTPDHELQRSVLPLMRAAANRGDLDKPSVALTIDRVRMNAGEPQVYGSQFHQVDGEWLVWPIENEESLDERRREMGLGPFEEYRERVLQMMSEGLEGGPAQPDNASALRRAKSMQSGTEGPER